MPQSGLPPRRVGDNAANLLLGATLFLLALMGVISYQTTQGFLRNDSRATRSNAVINSLQHVLSDLKDAETGQRGYIITGDESYLAPYRAGIARIGSDLDTAGSLIQGDPAEQQQMQQLRLISTGKLAELQRTIALRRSGGFQAALPVIVGGSGKTYMDQARDLIGQMRDNEQHMLTLRTKAAESAAHRAQRFVVVGFFLGAALVGLSAFVVHRYVVARRTAETEVRALNASLERRIEERTAMLEEANRELEAFSYSVSHDLRAPLRHISGFSDLLQKKAGPNLDETSNRYLKTIAQAAQHAGQLVDDLLAFSRMGRAEVRKTTLDMAQLIREVRDGMVLETEGRHITWETGDLVAAQGDPNMMRLVWQNLIGNAVKYTKTRDNTVITIGSERRDHETVYYVKDNGVGFDMRYIDKLFGVFQRLHGKEEFEGTGIGLAQVRRIMNRHGGRAWAEGVVGEGATFWFSLPDQVS